MAPPTETEGGTCPICLDYLESGTRVISLAPCGHILHRACYDRCAAAAVAGLGGPPGAPRCPMCRGSVAQDRIKNASAVPGARLAGGAGYAQYAARSAAPPAPPRELAWAAHASMAPVPTPAGGGLREAAGAPAAANIPASARDQLLAGIMAQLGAADPAAPPPAAALPPPAAAQGSESAGHALLRMLRQSQADRATQQTTAQAVTVQPAPAAVPAAPVAAAPTATDAPNTWCFSIDVSSSMGRSQDWQPGAVSRLCFALASLACVVDAKAAPGDWVTVQAFDAEQATLKPWFRKPAAFDKAAFLAELTGAVRACGLNRFGTNTCAATTLAVETLAAKANSLVESPPQQQPAHTAGTAQQGGAADDVGAAHSLVLLTDGWADDLGTNFASASALLCDPPFVAGGFKALLMHIAAEGEGVTCLDLLAAGPQGAPLDYVQVVRLQIGASLDLSTAAHAAAALPLPAEVAPPARPPVAPAAAPMTAAATQIAAAAAAPAIPAPPAFPMPWSGSLGVPSAARGAQPAHWRSAAPRQRSNWRPNRGWGAIPEDEDEDGGGNGGGSTHLDDWRTLDDRRDDWR